MSAGQTRTYRKPTFVPQYIPSWSFHRDCQFTGIYKTEAVRYLVNTNVESDFNRNITQLLHFLSIRGLAVDANDVCNVYDVSRRNDYLSKIENRSIVLPNDNVFTVVLDYSPHCNVLH